MRNVLDFSRTTVFRIILYLSLLPGIATRVQAQTDAQPPNYNTDVAPILQAKCQQCHHPNDIAPFSLLTYDDAVTYAQDISSAVSRKVMPPWKPVPGYGTFKGDYGLTDAERQTILDWVTAGTPQGDAGSAPSAPPADDSPWQIGPPDLVLQTPAYIPPIDSPDTYRCFSIPTGLDSRVYLSALQVLPLNRQMVHHVLVYSDPSGAGAALDGADGQPGYSCFGGPGVQGGSLLGAWVPGSRVRALDPGIGVLVPGNSRLVVQIHYHPSGRSGTDQSQVGLYFAPNGSIQHPLILAPVINQKFTIPAGAANYTVNATLSLPQGASGQLIMIAPHMHLLGRQIKMDLQLADGTSQPLIYIDNWDFNWQGFYTFDQPVAIPQGAQVKLAATYDNSDGNPNNPNNPIVPVSWGEGTNDEMCIGYLGFILDGQLPPGSGRLP